MEAMFPSNPFPGLRPFEAEEDHLFFGREKEIDDLLRRLRVHRFLSVIGTSGCGKSSLVRSGLIPSLHSGLMVKAGSSWRIAMMRPGEDPIGASRRPRSTCPDVLGAVGELAATRPRAARSDAAPRLARRRRCRPAREHSRPATTC